MKLRREEMWIFTFVAVVVSASIQVEAGGEVPNRPRHAVVRVGSNLSFTCRTAGADVTMRWDYIPSLSDKGELIFNGAKISSKFESRFQMVKDDSGIQNDLLIVGVQLSDAGTYVCYGPYTIRYAAALVVLEKDPVCRKQRLPDAGSVITCSVNYAGDWPPTFQCLPSTPTDANNVKPSRSVTFRQIVTSAADSDNVSNECSIRFDESKLRKVQSETTSVVYAQSELKYDWTVNTSAIVYGAYSLYVLDEVDEPAAMPGWAYGLIAAIAVVVVVQIVLLTLFLRKKLRSQTNGQQSRASDDTKISSNSTRVISSVSNAYEELGDVSATCPQTPSFYTPLCKRKENNSTTAATTTTTITTSGTRAKAVPESKKCGLEYIDPVQLASSDSCRKF